MLLRQNGSGREQRDLLVIDDRAEGRAEGDLRLAEPHVPAEQPVHDLFAAHIRADLVGRAQLVVRGVKFKGVLKRRL